MPRPRSAARPERHSEKQSARQPEAAGPARQPIPTIPLLLFAGIVIAFTWLFYTDAPDQTRAARTSALAFLAGPDHLLAMWCGGRLADFSLFDRWPIVLLAAVILCGAWLAGRLLLAALGVNPGLDRLERFVFAMGAGLNLLSLYALAVGLSGLLHERWVFAAPLVVLALANGWLAYRQRGAAPPQPLPMLRVPTDASGNNPRWYWLLAAAAPFAVIIAIGGMLPPFAYDVREYHLQAPKEWFQNSRIDFLPHNIYANMPLGAELNSVWAMSLVGGDDGWWWGALAGKMAMGCYSLITAAALVALGRRLHSLAAGCIAAAVFLSTPWTVVLAVTGYNESGVMLYALLAIFALWLAGRRERQRPSGRLTLLAGFLAGSAVACKYPPALFLIVPLTAWIAVTRFLLPSPSWRRAIVGVTLFLAAATAGCGLWIAKNWCQTGNPVYPLLYAEFDGLTRTPGKDRQWTKAHSPQPDASGRRYSPANLLSQLAWIGWRTLLASSVLVPLVAMSVLDRRRLSLVATLGLWMLFVFATWWLFTHRLDRFLLLLLPAASLLAAIGALALPHPAWRAATVAVVVWGLVSQFPFATLPLDDNRFFAPLAELRRDEPRLMQAVGVRLNPAQRWLNEHARSGERALLVGDAEPFELRIGAVYNTCFDDCQFARLFQGKSRAERLATLRDEQIRYVVFHWTHLARYRGPANYGYTSDYVTPELIHGELVAEQHLLKPIAIDADPNKVELYEVADP